MKITTQNLIKKIIFYFIFSINVFGLNLEAFPTQFHIDFKKNKTYELTVINNTGAPLRAKIYLEDIKGKKSLKENIRLFPRKLSIKPGSKNFVRFNLKNISSLKPGKYDCLLVVSEMEGKDFKTQNSDELSFNIKMYTEIALHIFGEKRQEE